MSSVANEAIANWLFGALGKRDVQRSIALRWLVVDAQWFWVSNPRKRENHLLLISANSSCCTLKVFGFSLARPLHGDV